MTPAHRLILDHRGVLALSGPDRVTFLQGLVTADVPRADQTRALWGAMLTPQGRCLDDFFLVAPDPETLLIEGQRDRLEDLKARLSRYTLRAAVTLEVRADWRVAVAFGAGAAAALGLPEDSAGAARGTAFVDPRLAEAGVRILLAPETPDPAEAAGLPLASLAEWERHRLTLGLTDGARDLPPEQTLPLENGFLELGGVGFAKGCYMGQEVTARTRYRGLVKKHLTPVVVRDGPLPAPGADLMTDDGRVVGVMRSGLETEAAGGSGLGLALVRKETLARGAVLHDSAGGARLEPRPPAWLTPSLTEEAGEDGS